MSSVFIVHHTYEWCGRDETKLIGAYATQAEAESAVSRVHDQPGFRDSPGGFSVEEHELGKDSWAEGFSIIVNIFVVSKVAKEEYHTVGSEWRPGDLYEICHIDDGACDLAFAVGDVVVCEEGLNDEYPQDLVAVRLASEEDA